eukprot:gene6473-6542_t
MASSRLKLLLVGARGTLGRAVAQELGPRHDILTAGKSSGDIRMDMADVASVIAGLEKAGPIDGLMCAAGKATFAPLADCEAANFDQSVYALGLQHKLMGQVNLALAARKHLRDGGSITLISGILSEQPIAAGSSSSMANGALEGFVRAAAIELPRGLRINLVSPNVFAESMDKYGPYFRGFEAVPVARAALAYSRSVEGLQTGQIYKVY